MALPAPRLTTITFPRGDATITVTAILRSGESYVADFTSNPTTPRATATISESQTQQSSFSSLSLVTVTVSASAPTSGSSSTSSSADANKRTLTGASVGTILGIVATLVFVFWWWRRIRKRKKARLTALQSSTIQRETSSAEKGFQDKQGPHELAGRHLHEVSGEQHHELPVGNVAWEVPADDNPRPA